MVSDEEKKAKRVCGKFLELGETEHFSKNGAQISKAGLRGERILLLCCRRGYAWMAQARGSVMRDLPKNAGNTLNGSRHIRWFRVGTFPVKEGCCGVCREQEVPGNISVLFFAFRNSPHYFCAF